MNVLHHAVANILYSVLDGDRGSFVALRIQRAVERIHKHFDGIIVLQVSGVDAKARDAGISRLARERTTSDTREKLRHN